MANADLTAQRLRELLSYNPTTGLFTRLSGRFKGEHAGHMNGTSGKANNYVRIIVDGEQYLAHRLVWLYQYGEWPPLPIDHIDGNGKNNALSNLRSVTQQINSQNNRSARRNNKSGLLGVCWSNVNNKWVSSLRHGDKRIWIGAFTDKHAAHAAYLEAKRRIHEGCTI
jgi:hypothetical protein